MAQSGPRHQEESFIIAGNRSWFRAFVDLLFTLFFWYYSFVVVFFILSATVGWSNSLTQVLNASFNTVNSDIRNLVFLAFFLFLVLYGSLNLNRLYNKKKFGSLTRRTYPEPVSNAELAALGLMDLETIENIQREDYTIFESNPITPLRGENR